MDVWDMVPFIADVLVMSVDGREVKAEPDAMLSMLPVVEPAAAAPVSVPAGAAIVLAAPPVLLSTGAAVLVGFAAAAGLVVAAASLLSEGAPLQDMLTPYAEQAELPHEQAAVMQLATTFTTHLFRTAPTLYIGSQATVLYGACQGRNKPAVFAETFTVCLLAARACDATESGTLLFGFCQFGLSIRLVRVKHLLRMWVGRRDSELE